MVSGLSSLTYIKAIASVITLTKVKEYIQKQYYVLLLFKYEISINKKG